MCSRCRGERLSRREPNPGPRGPVWLALVPSRLGGSPRPEATWVQHSQTPPGGATCPSADEAHSGASGFKNHMSDHICSQACPAALPEAEALAWGSQAGSGQMTWGCLDMGLGPVPSPQLALPLGRAT